MRRLAVVATLLLAAVATLLLAACSSPAPTPPRVAPPRTPAPPTTQAPDEDDEAESDQRLLDRRLRESCTVCHALEIPLSQRIPAATWTKVLEKMTRWGVGFRAGESDALHASLVKLLPEERPAAPARVLSGVSLDAALASVERAPRADAPPGDLARGAQAFRATCASCHGLDGRGGTTAGARGPNLLGLPVLWQEGFATIVRGGRGGMPGFAEATLPAQDLVDARAWLRAQVDEASDPTARTR